jgi:carboxypeptidase C (cathepsin A)
MRRSRCSRPILSLSVWLVCASAAGRAVGQETRPAGPRAPGASSAAVSEKAPSLHKTSVTVHTVTVNGRRLEYTASAGYLQTKDRSGKPLADLFYVAYVKAPPAGETVRPIAFAFNGGPGGSSVWLHLGALGPRRVLLPDEGKTLPRTFELVDNEYTWLEFTDLVFVDPVGTGYSRPAPGVDGKQFEGVTGDVASIASFICLYLTRYERWESPMFLVGESYGTTRAAALSRYLQDRLGIYPKGIVLISTALNFQTISFEPNNDLPYVLYLPSYTATAWYHKKLPKDLLESDLQSVVEKAERWASGEYLLALMQGDTLPKEQREKVAAELARYSGLPLRFVLRNNLRVSNTRFMKELLRDENRTVGIMDGRVSGFDIDPASGEPEYDPSMAIATAPFVACVNGYLRKDLEFDTDRRYRFLSMRVNEAWNWGRSGRQGLDVAPALKQAITENDHLKVFVASGYYDLNTAYFAKKYVFDHLGLNAHLRGNITSGYYPAGHQMYTDVACLKRLTADAAAFIKEAR